MSLKAFKLRSQGNENSMTTPEHTLVGIHFALAVSLDRYTGWRIVAMAAVASNVPDWDGLPMLFDMQRFESGHRVWGHSLLSIFLTSLLMGSAQVRWNWIGKVANWSHLKFTKRPLVADDLDPKLSSAWLMVLAYSGVAMVSQILHLICDMVASGGKGLSHWAIEPFWPFSSQAFVYPLIAWGDVGPTVILMSGLIIMAKRRSQVALTSGLTLLGLCAYLMVRSLF